MNSVLDDALVGAVLAASVLYAVYSLGPRAWRPRLLSRAAVVVGYLPQFFGLKSVAQRLTAAAASKSGACGGCDSCGSEATAPPVSGRSGAPTEVSVPLSKIGKRTGG